MTALLTTDTDWTGPSSPSWTSPRRPQLAMAHLPRELFISLVMDSASDWMVVRVPIIDFIRNVAALHGGAKVSLLSIQRAQSTTSEHHAHFQPRISYILYSAADTRPSPIDSSMFFCKGDQAHRAIQSLQAAPRNYIRGRLGSAVLEGLVHSIEVRTLV